MKISVGILTHNAVSGMRLDLLEQTLASIEVAFPGCATRLLDNGSTDGTEKFVTGKGGSCYVPTDGDCTPGRGCKALGLVLVAGAVTGNNILVMSDDDMIWKPGAAEVLKRFWSEDPPITVLCGYLEPDWAWNIPESVVESGDVRVLVRASAPTCAWTFRARDWYLLESLMPDGFGHDYKTCVALREAGHKIAQIDLAEHAGWGRSSHGNEAITMAKPLDRKKWGI